MCIWKSSVAMLATLAASGLMGVSEARAVLTMSLEGIADSSLVKVSLSGSTVSPFSVQGVSIANYGWEFSSSTFDPFPAAITGNDLGRFPFITGTGVFRNVTRDQSAPITGIWLQDSSFRGGGNERYGILYPGSFSWAAGDVFDWSASATIDLADRGLTFSDLRQGTSGVIEASLAGQLIVVPEANHHLASAIGGFAAMLWLRRRLVIKS